jgi:hypothetical protein
MLHGFGLLLAISAPGLDEPRPTGPGNARLRNVCGITLSKNARRNPLITGTSEQFFCALATHAIRHYVLQPRGGASS